ncbi:MAG: PQQ-like beta-propeller repeat protein [Armatimonadota bacterium]|nr:PQQ-like beta-propeller repeat protein [Armatimonadota bacterium]
MLSRTLASTICLAGLMSAALAVDGPMPLSWRWYGKTTVAPRSQPLLAGDSVVVGVGRRVYAVDAATGATKWAFPTAGDAGGEFLVSPAMSGDVIVAPSTNNFIYAIDRATGTGKWSMNLGTTNVRAVVAGKDVFYVFTNDDRILGLNAENGAKAWQTDYEIKGNIVGLPTMTEDHIIFFTTGGKLVGLNATTKMPSWEISVGSANPEGGPIAFGQSVYVVSGSQVAQINPRTGRTGWVAVFPERPAASVAMSDKGGAAVTENGKVFTFDAFGKLTRTEPIDLGGGYVAGGPQTAGGNIFVRTTGGSLVLIDPSRKTGEIVWEYNTSAIPGSTRAGSDGKPTDYVAILGPLAISDKAVYGLAEDGSLFAWGGSYGVDEYGPTIKMTSPAMGNVMWGQPDTTFHFKIEDLQTGVMSRSLSVTMNGTRMNHEYLPGSGVLMMKVRFPGSKEPGANNPLTDGRKTIVVAAGDWAGNITEKTFTVVIDNTIFEAPPPPPTTGNPRGGGGGPRGGGGGGRGGG